MMKNFVVCAVSAIMLVGVQTMAQEAEETPAAVQSVDLWAEMCAQTERMTDVLKAMTDADSAAAHLAELRACKEEMDELGHRMSDGNMTPDEKMQEHMSAAMTALADECDRLMREQCYGVGEIKAIMGVSKGISLDDADHLECVRRMKELTSELLDILNKVHDKESADASVAEMEANYNEIIEAEKELDAAREQMSEEEAKAVSLRMLVLLTQLSDAEQRLADNDYFGSDALREYISAVDTESEESEDPYEEDEEEVLEESAPLEGEEFLASNAALQEVCDTMTDVAELLQSITDRETAEAALDTLRSLQLRLQTAQVGIQEAMKQMTDEQRRIAGTAMMEAVSAIMREDIRLSEAEFYGCPELQEILTTGPRQTAE